MLGGGLHIFAQSLHQCEVLELRALIITSSLQSVCLAVIGLGAVNRATASDNFENCFMASVCNPFSCKTDFVEPIDYALTPA